MPSISFVANDVPPRMAALMIRRHEAGNGTQYAVLSRRVCIFMSVGHAWIKQKVAIPVAVCARVIADLFYTVVRGAHEVRIPSSYAESSTSYTASMF